MVLKIPPQGQAVLRTGANAPLDPEVSEGAFKAEQNRFRLFDNITVQIILARVQRQSAKISLHRHSFFGQGRSYHKADRPVFPHTVIRIQNRFDEWDNLRPCTRQKGSRRQSNRPISILYPFE